MSYELIKKYAFKRRLIKKHMILLDFIQDKFLYLLARFFDQKFSLKGDTLLYKLYNTGRFSFDLDLSAPIRIKTSKVLRQFEKEGFTVEIQKKRRTKRAAFERYMFRREGLGETTLSLEVIKTELNGEVVEFNSPYPSIPVFHIITMSLEEVLRHKINAILQRQKPRDVYDVYMILKKYGIQTSIQDKNALNKALHQVKDAWPSLEEMVTVKLPSFQKLRDSVLHKVRESDHEENP